jgi:ketosteroid isomerase-like protein
MSEDLLNRFYQAFQRRDGATMAACYAPDAHFTDPAFDLRGSECGAMWQMLVARGKDLQIRYHVIEADATRGSVNWEADYTFSQTGRYVRNKIHAQFEFRDGLIVRHTDTFPFHRWASQALGPMGWLLGRTGWLQGKVRSKARAGLDAYLAKALA